MAIKWGTVAAVVLTGAAVIGSPIFTLFAKDKNGTIHLGWFVGQVLCVLAAAAVPYIAGLVSKRADVAARIKARLQFTRTLGPILWTMMEHTIDDPKSRDDQIISDVVNAAAHIVGPAGEALETRSCYYELVQVNGIIKLKLKEKVGRDNEVMTTFDDTSERGRHAIDLVIKKGDPILVENVKTRKKKKKKAIPPGWSDDGDTSYKTFISAGVRGPDMGYGMLTVDAPKPGDLSDYDKSVVNFLGLILALGRTIPEAFVRHLKDVGAAP
jgi:hypothetical protein